MPQWQINISQPARRSGHAHLGQRVEHHMANIVQPTPTGSPAHLPEVEGIQEGAVTSHDHCLAGHVDPVSQSARGNHNLEAAAHQPPWTAGRAPMLPQLIYADLCAAPYEHCLASKTSQTTRWEAERPGLDHQLTYALILRGIICLTTYF